MLNILITVSTTDSFTKDCCNSKLLKNNDRMKKSKYTSWAAITPKTSILQYSNCFKTQAWLKCAYFINFTVKFIPWTTLFVWQAPPPQKTDHYHDCESTCDSAVWEYLWFSSHAEHYKNSYKTWTHSHHILTSLNSMGRTPATNKSAQVWNLKTRLWKKQQDWPRMEEVVWSVDGPVPCDGVPPCCKDQSKTSPDCVLV